MIRKEAEKIAKYEDLTLDIEGMWIVNTKVITSNKRATGTISNYFRQHLSKILGMDAIKELQKSNIGHRIHTAEGAHVKGHRSVVYLSIKCLLPG